MGDEDYFQRQKMVKHTQHSRARMQQRGISQSQIQLLEIFGEDRLQKGDTYHRYIPEKKLRVLKSAIDSLKNISAIYGDQNKLITIFHKTKKTRSTEYTA